ncbi:S-layer homology domain-containing protein [Gordoniibacillus kamchatkensis]|uniref:S-layer homology domain-containing protein n=1 Tax=Gordoniibacillus kamchatkensis TaxID=1590651 RepID=UPI0009E62774
MDEGAFTDRAGHEIAEISDKSMWAFSTVPATTVVLTATAGNRQAGLSWNAIPEANAYEVYQRLASGTYGDSPVATVTDAVYSAAYTATGLTNGTTYYFKVRAMNAGEEVAVSNEASATPRSPSGGGSSTPAQPTAPPEPETANKGADVLVNGKVENAGTATTTKRNDQTVTTITIDQKKLDDRLAAEGQGAVVTIPANAKSDVVVGELNGQMVKNMEDKQAVLEIKTDRAAYTLPAQQINISAVSDQIGKSVALQDIKVQVEIAAPAADTVKVVENAAAKGTFTLVASPLDFTVKAAYGDTVIEVSKFNAYVERTIAIPDGADPARITTGVVVEPDGTVRHVPTRIILIDGKYYAKINSLTNSTYTVVWQPLEFGDVANHWAKDAVNDMGSRMIIEGTGNGMFSPDRDITRAEFAAIIVRGLGLKLENETTPFSDVKVADWYNSAVNTAYAYHLINGFEDGTFRPNDKITREQAMIILSKAMAITGLKAKLTVHSADATLRPFGDAAGVSSWAISSITDCVQAGIVSGRSGTELAPKAFITRAEVAAMVERLLQKSDLI